MHFDTAMYSFPVMLQMFSLTYIHLATYITKIIIFYYRKHNYIYIRNYKSMKRNSYVSTVATYIAN